MSERVDTAARRLIDSRRQRDEDKAKATKSEKRYRARERDFYELLEQVIGKGSKTHTIDLGPGYGVVQFGRRSTIRSRIIDLDKALAAFEAEQIDDELVKREPRKAQLNELVRERLETGQPLPDGVDFTRTPYISISRKKRGGSQ